MSKVVKFGGSSLASAEQFRKVGDIVRSDAERRYVVPSAPGKRFDSSSPLTISRYLARMASSASLKSLPASASS